MKLTIAKTALFCFSLFMTRTISAQEKKSDSLMITVFLKHQQDKNLAENQEILKANKFYETFPPASAKVVSWYVMMGIGQVVTVKIPASELRTFNLSIEKSAWKAFNTEFYPTYDYKPIWEDLKKKNVK
ncbi:hypothetical protein VUJ46_04995 [Chryseobacterium sp. MYb264]|uniref:hypothetical protein n=1 Tax=Chryseobacterium sp. MYb264 TaxID=2745153 RepID=UPI002E0D4B98|nr:hypothetical protein VUJ46_04995 [Chryseobacterium sp. MYb264]